MEQAVQTFQNVLGCDVQSHYSCSDDVCVTNADGEIHSTMIFTEDGILTTYFIEP